MKINIIDFINSSCGDDGTSFFSRRLVDDFFKIVSINDDIKPDIIIRKSCHHDGTLLFRYELVAKLLVSIWEEIDIYFQNNFKQKDIIITKVEITNIELIKTFYKGGEEEVFRFPHQKDEVSLGVKMHYTVKPCAALQSI